LEVAQNRLPVAERGFRPVDLHRLLDLVSDCRRIGPHAVVLHPGDVQWRLARLPHAAADVRVWEDGAGLAGFAVSDPGGGEVWWLAHPRAPGVADAALVWALDHLRSAGIDAAEAAVPDDDCLASRALEARGFVRNARHFIELSRDLDWTLPGPAPPPGFRLATLARAGSTDALVELHRDAWARWGPSSYSIEAHRRVEAMPGFEPDLVPVAVDPEGRLVSSCICWLDAATLVGEIEPLGASRAFARVGLGRAVVLEACRIMRERGMRTAYVSGSSVNAPALRLYASVGFRRGRRSSAWIRSLSSPGGRTGSTTAG
jgi:ribosomal protein S18 acetylase RimI-like enzyme